MAQRLMSEMVREKLPTVTLEDAERTRRAAERQMSPDSCKLICDCGRVLGRLVGEGETLHQLLPRGHQRSDAIRPAPNPALRPQWVEGEWASMRKTMAWRKSRVLVACRNPRCSVGEVPLRLETLGAAYARARRSQRVEVRLREDVLRPA